MVKITILDDAFSESVNLEASPVEGKSLKQRGEERKVKKNKF